jgi:hypothetical protein
MLVGGSIRFPVACVSLENNSAMSLQADDRGRFNRSLIHGCVARLPLTGHCWISIDAHMPSGPTKQVTVVNG